MLHMRRWGWPFGPPSRTLKGHLMKTLIAHLRSMAAKQATYRRLRAEIAGLSHAEALDLGIFPGDADRIARQAVWG